MQTRNLKQALNHELVLKKVHIFIELNQEAWLKPYIDINAELRKNAYPSVANRWGASENFPHINRRGGWNNRRLENFPNINSRGRGSKTLN